MMDLTLRKIRDFQKLDLDRVRELYLSSFPAEERRKWSSLLERNRCGDLDLLGIYADGALVGMITVWKFADFAYVEHFATLATVRGQGIGERVLRMLPTLLPEDMPIVVEVEHADTGDFARRRIAFYQRCGFTPISDYEYIQPPYSPELPSVPLLLMATATVDARKVDNVLKQNVYDFG